MRGRSEVELVDFESDFDSDLVSVFGVPFFVGALLLTWAGVGVLVLAGEGAEGGGVGALAAAVVELDDAVVVLLFTEGLFSRSLSLDWAAAVVLVWPPAPVPVDAALLDLALLPERGVCLTVALNAGRQT